MAYHRHTRYSTDDRRQFFALLKRYRGARSAAVSGDSQAGVEFLRLSILIHAAKATVPKRLWPLVNKEVA